MIGLTVLTGALLLGQPASSPPADLNEVVRRLVLDLDAAEKATRDQAEQQLLNLGPKALESLPPPSQRESAEVRLRLARVRDALQKQWARSVVEATKITLQKKDMPLADVFAEFEKQTGNKIIDYREQFGQESGELTVTVDFEGTPFWKAFDAVLDQAQFDVYGYADPMVTDGGLAVTGRGNAIAARSGAAAYVQSFRIAPLEATSRRDYRSSAAQALQIMMEFAWEPRLRPLVMMQSFADLKATDDRGEPLPVSDSDVQLTLGIDPTMSSLEYPINFALPDRAAKSIATLQGTINLLMGGRSEQFRFEKISPAAPSTPSEQTKAGATVKFAGSGRNSELYEVSVILSYDKPGNAFASHLSWVDYNTAYLLDEKDRRIPYAAVTQTIDNETQKGRKYLFDVLGSTQTYTFVYETPGVLMTAPIDFQLNDIALP